MFFRNRFLVETLSPTAYSCFLFHQMVAQWYFAATRSTWWDYWRFRKTQYWFSPNPCPVEWYEFFTVVALTVAFSKLMASIEPVLTDGFFQLKRWVMGGGPTVEEMEPIDIVIDVVEGKVDRTTSGKEPRIVYPSNRAHHVVPAMCVRAAGSGAGFGAGVVR